MQYSYDYLKALKQFSLQLPEEAIKFQGSKLGDWDLGAQGSLRFSCSSLKFLILPMSPYEPLLT